MRISIIVAMTNEGVIGINNRLPWHLSDDLKRFKKITMGHPVIVGQKTFESLGKPLPGRRNIVMSDDPHFKAEGATVVHSFEEALAACPDKNEEVFIIGGVSIYRLALPHADRLYITLIHNHIEGDAFFPPFDFEGQFKVVQKEANRFDPQEKISYSFITADRINGGRATGKSPD
ncbi:MAG: dihydrofolate reductase [Elusimicrobia bacterium]|nr:dihydrofolate reductase [Candidatus Obscuribacterium magneticum]